MSSEAFWDVDRLGAGEPPHVEVYTDGGCEPNPGPGGWGAIIRFADHEWVLSGNDPDTTNNRMELHAAASALALLEGLFGRCQVEMYTDSEYLRQGITEWIDDWVRNRWRTRGRQPVKNQDLWRVLHRLTQAHDITWHWLRGHEGHPLNERADRLAADARRALHRGPGFAVSAQPNGAAHVHQPTEGDRPAVEICVKASCQGARGPGGWAAVLRMGDHVRALSGGEPSTTANAMLIRGATEALRTLTRPCRVTLYADAEYLVKGASLWLKSWQARGWRTQGGKPVANRAAWEALIEAMKPHQVTWLLAHGDAAPSDLAQAGALAAQAAQTAAGGEQ